MKIRSIILASGAALGVLAWLVPSPLAGATGTTLLMADGTFIASAPIVVHTGQKLVVRDATLYLDASLQHGSTCAVVGCAADLLVEPGGMLVLDHARLTTHGASYQVQGEGASVIIVDSVVDRMGSMVFELPGPSRSLVSGSWFHDGGSAIAFLRGATVDVGSSTFSNLTSGVAIRDTDATLVGNAFADIAGRAIDVQATVVGEKASPTTVVVRENTIERSDWGLLLLNGAPDLVANNTFRGDRVALVIGLLDGVEMAHTTPPIVRGDLFEANGIAVSVTLEDGAPTPLDARVIELHENAFVGSCTDVYVPDGLSAGLLTVDASGSWWGTSEGPLDEAGCVALRGPGIVASPWLAAPITGAGASRPGPA